MTVITDWRDGRIQGWVDVPAQGTAAALPKARAGEDAPLADQKKIVTEWAKEFKLEDLFPSTDDAAAEGEEAAGDVEMQT
jgi:nuclear GTP-binding protein